MEFPVFGTSGSSEAKKSHSQTLTPCGQNEILQPSHFWGLASFWLRAAFKSGVIYSSQATLHHWPPFGSHSLSQQQLPGQVRTAAPGQAVSQLRGPGLGCGGGEASPPHSQSMICLGGHTLSSMELRQLSSAAAEPQGEDQQGDLLLRELLGQPEEKRVRQEVWQMDKRWRIKVKQGIYCSNTWNNYIHYDQWQKHLSKKTEKVVKCIQLHTNIIKHIFIWNLKFTSE